MSALPEFGPLCVPFFVDPDLLSAEAQDVKTKYIGDDTGARCCVACHSHCYTLVITLLCSTLCFLLGYADEIVTEVTEKLQALSDAEFNPVRPFKHNTAGITELSLLTSSHVCVQDDITKTIKAVAKSRKLGLKKYVESTS